MNTPQFPGQQLGATIEQVRTLIKKQKRMKGFKFAAPVGTSSMKLDLSGNARMLIGFAMYAKPKALDTIGEFFSPAITFLNVEQVTLKVNNEIIVDQVDPNFLSFGLQNDEYYFLPRPLSGTDDINMTFLNSGTNTENLSIIMYFI